MIVKRLRLVGYKRLSLGGVRELIYTPEQKVQLILGTNGSGKSSMLKELFPLPADLTSEFDDNGLKEITVEHRGSVYELTNTKTNGSIRHSFVKDGVELNTTGKKSLQTHLVSEHFGIKPQLRDLLIGSNNFTGMSPAERKKFFISVSDIDYEVAMGTYNKVRKAKMDTKANIAMLSSRILSHKSKLITPEEKERLRDKIAFLNKLIEHYLVKKDSSDKSVFVDRASIAEIEEEIKELSARIERTYREIKNTPGELDQEALTQNIHKVRADINAAKAEYSELMDFISKTNEMLDEGKGATVEKLEELKATRSNIEGRIAELAGKIEPPVSKPFVVTNDVITQMDRLVNLLPGADEPYLDSRVADEVTNELVKLKAKLNSTVSEENYTVGRLEALDHAKECQDITCPKCKHTWKPNYSPVEESRLESKLQVIKNTRAELESEIRSLENYLTRFGDFTDTINIINYATTENPRARGLLQWLLGSDSSSRTKDEVSKRYFTLVNETIPSLNEWLELDDKLKEINAEIEKAKVYLDAERAGVVERLKNTEERAKEVSARISSLTNRLTTLERRLYYLKTLRKLYSGLRAKIKELKLYKDAKLKELHTETINNIIKFLRLELQTVESEFIDGTKAEPLIEADTKQLKELEREKEVLEKLERALSPTEGVIADSIVTFINGYLAEMNRILEKVWEYPIELLPCDLEEGELSYRFPVRINNSFTTKDISQTSSSMKEIIDLAFKIVFMQVSDMTDYPLYMDEFGKSMDEKHQDNAFKVIDVLSNSDFEQVFLISHYEHCYGRFSHADVNVMHEGNLSNVVNSGRLVLQ